MESAKPAWIEADLERIASCAACGSSELIPHYSGLIDHDEGVPGIWSMSVCNSCSTLLLNPRPTPQALPKAYGSYYTHIAPDNENGPLHAGGSVAGIIRGYLKQRFGLAVVDQKNGYVWLIRLVWPLRQQLDYFMRHLPRQSGSLLDVGCGSGGFLIRAAMAGWQVSGVEPDPVAAAMARQHATGPVYANLDDVKGNDIFDAVTLAHVVEHVHDPRDILGCCMHVLKPGGTLWLATPNIRSWGHRYYRDAWQPLETPRHLVMAPGEELCKMMSGLGFTEVALLRRGRGSRKRLLASSQRARKVGRGAGMPNLFAILIDLYASVFRQGAEELVLVGKKPAQ